jgi:hypothetical protein
MDQSIRNIICIFAMFAVHSKQIVCLIAEPCKLAKSQLLIMGQVDSPPLPPQKGRPVRGRCTSWHAAHTNRTKTPLMNISSWGLIVTVSIKGPGT